MRFQYVDGAKLTVINRSVAEVCYGRRVFNLQRNEAARSSALARNHLRNSCIQNMSIFPHGRQDIWSWAASLPFALENCAVRRLGIHAGIIPTAAQAIDQGSFVRLLSLEDVSVLKLDLTYPALEELLRTGPMSGHRVFAEIRKLVLKVSMVNRHPATPTTIDISWIRNLLCLPKCTHVEVLAEKPRFTDNLDITGMRRIFCEIAQTYVDSASFDSLPTTFMLDVNSRSFAYDELPFVPFSERTLKTRFATHSGAGTFNARIYRLTNAHGGQTFDVTTGRPLQQMSVYAFRVFKDSQF